jgi:hypothetical protein
LGKKNPIQVKNVLRLIVKIGGGTRSEGRRCSSHRATMMSFEKIVGVIG